MVHCCLLKKVGKGARLSGIRGVEAQRGEEDRNFSLRNGFRIKRKRRSDLGGGGGDPRRIPGENSTLRCLDDPRWTARILGGVAGESPTPL